MPKTKIEQMKASVKEANSITRKALRRVAELQRNATALENDVNFASKSDEIIDDMREDRKYADIFDVARNKAIGDRQIAHIYHNMS